MTEFQKGDKVMIKGERGTYIVQRTIPYPDGSYLLFGGSTNPNARQRFRNVQPEVLKIDKRAQLRKDNAEV